MPLSQTCDSPDSATRSPLRLTRIAVPSAGFANARLVFRRSAARLKLGRELGGVGANHLRPTAR